MFEESVTARRGGGLTLSAHVRKTLHWTQERGFLLLRNKEPRSGELDDVLLRQNPNVDIFPLPSTASRVPRQLSRYSDSLRAGRFGDRIPVEARLSASVQTGPGAHPTSCIMCTGSLSGDRAAGAWHLPPTPSSAEVKERVKLYLYSPSGYSRPLLGLTLPLPTRRHIPHASTNKPRACLLRRYVQWSCFEASGKAIPPSWRRLYLVEIYANWRCWKDVGWGKFAGTVANQRSSSTSKSTSIKSTHPEDGCKIPPRNVETQLYYTA